MISEGKIVEPCTKILWNGGVWCNLCQISGSWCEKVELEQKINQEQ